MGRSHPNALLLNGEVAAVLACIRSSTRWSSTSRHENEYEDPLGESLRTLRRKLFSWEDWSEVEPLEYLTPFLDVIKSPETSGNVTDVALTAVYKILQGNLLGDSFVGVRTAIQALTEAVTQCKFEATYPAFDECVLNRILDVLAAAVNAPEGRHLSHDHLINIFQACYRIGHYQTEKGRETSELLTQASRRAMTALVSAIFSQLPRMQPVLSGRVSPLLQSQTGPRLCHLPSSFPSIEGQEAHKEDDIFSTAQPSRGAGAVADAPPAPIEDLNSEPARDTDANIAGPTQDPSNADQVHHEIVSVLSPIRIGHPDLRSAASQEVESALLSPVGATGMQSDDGYGIDTLCEVLRFTISFIGAPPSRHHNDLPAHGLDLVLVALHAAGPNVRRHAALLALLREDLVKALFEAARKASLPCLASICQTALALYIHGGTELLLQIEALIGLLLLPLAEGRTAASEDAQLIALEGIVDFCNQPGFVTEMYLNFDCRIQRSNLYEQVCTLLSRAAFPVNGPVSAAHMLALDGIMAILAALGSQSDTLNDSSSFQEDEEQGPNIDALGGPEINKFVDLWTPLTQGADPPVLEALFGGTETKKAKHFSTARAEKIVKSRLASVAEHFNRDPKKGFQYCQSLSLLPSTLDAASVARFLRVCPGLAKAAVGEILGERDAFYNEVREAFIDTFDFRDMEFDMALRLYMDAFRPPGEGQKIDRIMQVFGRRYYQQAPHSGLKNADAAYILAFSVIMLNTDIHNPQNKKKMSLEDFARMNDRTNDGEPMPQQLLRGIFSAISENELKISSECSPDELAKQKIFWEELNRLSQTHPGLDRSIIDNAIERDMFTLVWGPTLAAVSVVIDGTENAAMARRAMDGLLVAARLAMHHGVPDVADQLVGALSKYTGLASIAGPKPAVALGESEKARAAMEATFAIANRYGDALRGGWRHVLDCIVRLHKADLLPPASIAAEGEDIDAVEARMPRPLLTKTKGSSGSLFSRAINSLISIETVDGAGTEAAAAREQMALTKAVATAAACRVEDLLADSKFLTAESLVELVKATMWAGGNVVAAARTGEASDTAELALELLITLTLRNRDRVGLIWPLVHEYLAACTSPDTTEDPSPLVARAVGGLFRVCQRLLPYKEETAEMLLTSLGLVVGMAPTVTWALAEGIASETRALLRTGGRFISSEAEWRTIAALLRNASNRPEALPGAFEALNNACRDSAALSSESYMPLLETSLQLIDRYKSQNTEAAARFLDCADALFAWLPVGGRNIPDELLVDLWLTSVGVLARGLCREESQQLRDTSMAALHRTLIGSAGLNLPAELWVQTTGELLVPLVDDLAKLAASSKGGKSRQGMEKTVRLAVNMLTKVLLQYVPVMLSDRDFLDVWSHALDALQHCMTVRHEAVLESVPENVKNLILVLASSGILMPGWTDAQGRDLWQLTWTKVGSISSGLNPGMLAGLATKEAPRPATADKEDQDVSIGVPDISVPEPMGHQSNGVASGGNTADSNITEAAGTVDGNPYWDSEGNDSEAPIASVAGSSTVAASGGEHEMDGPVNSDARQQENKIASAEPPTCKQT